MTETPLESVVPGPEPTAAEKSLAHYLFYTISLPERTVRSTVGIAAGTLQEAASLLVPSAFQTSKTYEVVVRNSLRFLTDDVGGAKPAVDPNAQPAQDDYLARKTVGNFLDLAGLATLHLSPLWMLAIVSDVAYGSRSYLKELARELKEQGLIDENSTINHAEDLLTAIQKSSGQAAGLFDTPPLSVEQLRKTLNETRETLSSTDVRKVLPEGELNRYWEELRQISQQEHVSLLHVGSAVTMQSLKRMKTITHGTLMGIQVAGGLFNRHVVMHYFEAVQTIHKKGFYSSLSESYQPYLEGVWNNFSSQKLTWTEQLIRGHWIKSITSLFRRKAKVAPVLPAEPPPADPSCHTEPIS
ncbi:MAG: hypothetical protein O3A29_03665 [Planctomycetota bacterium]|nr:hypothetical protein [Planctomycetota bacterium]